MKRLLMQVGLVLLLATAIVRGEVRLPAVIASKMVLQRDKPVAIWGKASAGEGVTVEFNRQTKTASADQDGNWRVMLDATPAGGPFQMSVRGKDSTRKLDDILVGDVWLCSGQSNMEFELNRSATSQEALATADHPTLRLFKVTKDSADEPKSDCEGAWEASGASTVAEFSAVGYYFGRHLQDELAVPIGLIESSWGGTPIEAWTSRAALESNSEFAPIFERARENQQKAPQLQAMHERRLKAWQQKADDAKAKGEPAPRKPGPPAGLQPAKQPNQLYNAMIAPLAPYTMRGVIWYQGEANAARATQYRKLLPTMIQDWRSAWRDDSLPFGIVQLPNFGRPTTLPVQPSAWAEQRETQWLVAKSTPHVGFVTTIDLGQNDNIHPTRKREVGDRLALWALASVYGKQVVFSGPLYRSMKVEGSMARVSFDSPGGGLKAEHDAMLHGFAIAGADRKFVAAQAVIDGDDVVVSSDLVSAPVAVRYAWADSPDCNLYNVAGLPASPFRTDDWPGVTDDKR